MHPPPPCTRREDVEEGVNQEKSEGAEKEKKMLQLFPEYSVILGMFRSISECSGQSRNVPVNLEMFQLISEWPVFFRSIPTVFGFGAFMFIIPKPAPTLSFFPDFSCYFERTVFAAPPPAQPGLVQGKVLEIFQERCPERSQERSSL